MRPWPTVTRPLVVGRPGGDAGRCGPLAVGGLGRVGRCGVPEGHLARPRGAPAHLGDAGVDLAHVLGEGGGPTLLLEPRGVDGLVDQQVAVGGQGDEPVAASGVARRTTEPSAVSNRYGGRGHGAARNPGRRHLHGAGLQDGHHRAGPGDGTRNNRVARPRTPGEAGSVDTGEPARRIPRTVPPRPGCGGTDSPARRYWGTAPRPQSTRQVSPPTVTVEAGPVRSPHGGVPPAVSSRCTTVRFFVRDSFRDAARGATAAGGVIARTVAAAPPVCRPAAGRRGRARGHRGFLRSSLMRSRVGGRGGRGRGRGGTSQGVDTTAASPVREGRIRPAGR